MKQYLVTIEASSIVMAENEEEALRVGRKVTLKIEDDLYWEFRVRRFPGKDEDEE